MTKFRANWLAIVIGSIALGGCVSGPAGNDLADDPAFAIDFPGAVELHRNITDPSWSPEGQNNARAVRGLEADGTRDDIFAFYDRALLDLGWHQSLAGLRGGCSHPAHEWAKDDRSIALSWVEENDVPDTARAATGSRWT